MELFILVINQLDAQNLFYNKFISCLYMFRAPCAHRQEVKIVLYSLWYHQTYRCDDTTFYNTFVNEINVVNIYDTISQCCVFLCSYLLCVLVFTVFYIVLTVFLYCFVYVYLLLFVLSVLVLRTTATE